MSFSNLWGCYPLKIFKERPMSFYVIKTYHAEILFICPSYPVSMLRLKLLCRRQVELKTKQKNNRLIITSPIWVKA